MPAQAQATRAPVTSSAAEFGMSDSALRRIDDHLTRVYVGPGKFAGTQTLVYRRGRIVYQSSLGHADRERQVPIKDDTIFRIYSMTKPITSVRR